MPKTAPRLTKALLMTTLAALHAGACSNRARYDGLQTTNRMECARNREDCPDRPACDAYEREREKLLIR
jgi:hypothetical protein